uniref:Uncharacterized protein n=1 Tax=Solanum tuberosum TaxID=4113 RepID=M1ASE0_SOLTU
MTCMFWYAKVQQLHTVNSSESTQVFARSSWCSLFKFKRCPEHEYHSTLPKGIQEDYESYEMIDS